jgi:adhesin/invasin
MTVSDHPQRHDRRSRNRSLAFAFLAIAAGALLVGSGSAGAAGCPTSNQPNTLRIVGGSPQTAQLGKQFQTNLQVTLANTNGCPLTGSLGGVSVDFVAPSMGASGTFASSGSSSVTVGTDASGTATASSFTANDTVGSYSVHAQSDYGTVKLYLTNTASGVVASIAATGQTDQAATVNSQYSQPLQAQVLDANGRPVQGANVTFSLGTGSNGAGASFLGGGAQATALTNSSGQATSPSFVANASPGRFIATASTSGISSVATFSLDNHAVTTTITATTSTAQTAAVNSRYPEPLQTQVLDAAGRPIEGTAVTFTLTQAAGGAGASFVGGASQATATTDAEGRATSPILVANKTAGRFTATAAIAGNSNPVSYSLRNLAGKPVTITAGAATGQSTRAGSRFPIRLAVTVTDADNNPVAGVLVTFTAPARGPSGRFKTRQPADARIRKRRVVRVETNSKGIAVAPAFTANAKPGGYVVTATVPGTHASFALVNTR